MPTFAILQPPRKKAKRKAKVVKKRQKTIPVLLPSLSPLLLLLILLSPLPAMPVKLISIDKINEDKNKNIKEPIKVEDKDVDSPLLLLLLPLIHFTSI